MAAPRYMSPNYHSIAQAADNALESASGLRINFRVAQYGNLDNCKRQAVSFQKSFAALRSRMNRKEEQTAPGGSTIGLRDSEAKGKYVNLACMLEILNNAEGWCVVLIRSTNILENWDIEDIATGKPYEEIGMHQREGDALWEKFCRAFYGNDNATFSEAQCVRLVELQPGNAEFVEQYRAGVRQGNVGRIAAPVAPEPQANLVDLADLSEEELSFGGGVDGGKEGD